MEKFDSPVRGNILQMRSLRDEHNGSKACNDADPRPALRNRVHRIYLTAPLASIMGSATLCFSRWTQRRRRQLHRCQNRRKHRARLLTEKALCCRRPVRPREEKIVYGGEALPLARQIESSQLMAAQGQGAVSPLHLGTGALEHGRQSLGLVMEV